MPPNESKPPGPTDPELNSGAPPANLAAMRRILKTNAESDRDDPERELRKWFLRDPERFMAEVREAERDWASESRRKKHDKERRLEKKAAAVAEPEEPAGPGVLADEGSDRCEELCREVLRGMASRAKEGDGES